MRAQILFAFWRCLLSASAVSPPSLGTDTPIDERRCALQIGHKGEWGSTPQKQKYKSMIRHVCFDRKKRRCHHSLPQRENHSSSTSDDRYRRKRPGHRASVRHTTTTFIKRTYKMTKMSGTPYTATGYKRERTPSPERAAAEGRVPFRCVLNPPHAQQERYTYPRKWACTQTKRLLQRRYKRPSTMRVVRAYKIHQKFTPRHLCSERVQLDCYFRRKPAVAHPPLPVDGSGRTTRYENWPLAEEERYEKFATTKPLHPTARLSKGFRPCRAT